MKEYIFHSFTMGDVDDPEIYAAAPLYDWMQTEKGKWVTEHSLTEPYFSLRPNKYYGYDIIISAVFNDKDQTWFALKYQ